LLGLLIAWGAPAQRVALQIIIIILNKLGNFLLVKTYFQEIYYETLHLPANAL
jgi:hypothetical protein